MYHIFNVIFYIEISKKITLKPCENIIKQKKKIFSKINLPILNRIIIMDVLMNQL